MNRWLFVICWCAGLAGVESWQVPFNAGLAAANAGQSGPAAVALLEARRCAPWRPEPEQALAVLGVVVPATRCSSLGVIAWPGTGWLGVVLLAVAGSAAGWAVAGRQQRGRAALLALGTAALAAPGLIAWHGDARDPLAATARPTLLLDASATAQESLPAGQLVTRQAAAPWQGRVLVRLADGRTGWLPAADLALSP